MKSDLPNGALNYEGYFDSTASKMLSMSNKEFAEYMIYYLKHHLHKKNGLGQISYLRRRQYIRDKLEMIHDEFLVSISDDEVRYICTKCIGVHDIDAACRGIILRAYEEEQHD